MKRSKLFPVLILSIVAFLSASCQQKESELQTKIKEFNEQCPQSLGLMGEVTSIVYEDDDVVITFTMNEQVVNLMVFESNMRVLRQSMINSFKNSDGDLKEIIDQVVAEDANLVVRYVGATTNKTIEVKITSDELKNSIAKQDSPEKVSLDALQSRVDVLNSQLPAQMDEGMVLTNVTMEEEYVVYNINVDEEKYPIEALENDRAQLEESLKKWLKSSGRATTEMSKLCKDTGRGIAHRYTGERSQQSCFVGVPASEL